MRLRTRLALAFFLLAVLPLTAVTLYSYYSSQRAVRELAVAEAGTLATELSHRMALVADDVQRRMDRFWRGEGGGTLGTRGPGADPEQLGRRVASALGAAAGLVDHMEFVPTPPAAPAPPDPKAGTSAALPPPPPLPPGGRAGLPPGPRGGRSGPPLGPGGGRMGFPPGEKVAIPSRIVVDLAAVKELQAQLTDSQASSAAVAELTPEAQRQLQIQLRETERVIREAQRLTAVAARARMEAKRAEQEGQAPAQAAARGNGSPPRGAGAADRPGPPDGSPDFRRDGRIRFAVWRDGAMVGTVNAEFNLERMLGAVMGLSRIEQGEIAFAVDAQRGIHTLNPDNLEKLKAMSLADRVEEADGRSTSISTAEGDWVLVSRRDASGVTFGIARPISEALRGVRNAAVRNLGLGLSVVALAFLGIIPLSHRMTRNLSTLTGGARQIAQGDLSARVPVRSRDEFGQLAQAFNQMAHDLEGHQQMLVQQERLNRELELSRQIQTEMLPQQPLRLGLAEVTGVSIPAREVGGDFFNYFALADGTLALLVGDVSGKGVSAALLMANVQATLRARLPLDPDLAHLVGAVDREIDQSTPRGVFLTLFIGIFDPATRTLRYVNAGHNPPYVLRSSGVDRIPSTGLPVGMFAGHGYEERTVSLGDGDALFFYTDGMVEVENEAGDLFGTERLEPILEATRPADRERLLARVEDAVRAFGGGAEPYDDATMMLLRLVPAPATVAAA